MDPVTCNIRYIGRTKGSLNTRLNGHLSKSKLKRTHKDYWIQSLMRRGLLPKIKQFKKIGGWKESHLYEKSLIAKCISHGFDLVNADDRGEGGVNKIITVEQRNKISSTLKEGYKLGKVLPTRTTSVSVFDLNGNFIKIFNSLSECSSQLSIPYSSLEKVLSKKCKRWKSYQITYGEKPDVYFIKKDMSCLHKKINLVNIENGTTTEFESRKSLACYLNTSNTQIRRYLDNGKIFKNIYRIQMPV